MTEPWKLLEKDRIDAFNSNKYIFDANTQGTGKSWSWISTLLNRNKYNVFIDNTHELNDEINLGMLYNHNIDIGNKPAVINLFGKDFDKISTQLQRDMGYPKCICNFHDDPNYYLKKLNYLPSEWCSYPEKIKEGEIESLSKEKLVKLKLQIKEGYCPYIYECKHKKMIKTAINSLKDENHANTNIIWLMVKAYLDTDMIDKFLGVDKPVGVIDENILKLCFEQVTLKADAIIKFNNLVTKIVERNKYLKETWKPVQELLKLITNYLTFDKEEKIEKQAKKITEKIVELLESYKIEDIIKSNGLFN